MNFRSFFMAVCLALPTVGAVADTFTMNSPTGGTLPSSISAVGGIVTDLLGVNGVRVVAQVAANTEFVGYVPGYPNVSSTPSYLLFGRQTGITAGVVAALGGGLQSASFRITLYDGDSQFPDFDFNQDSLVVGASGGTVGQATATSTGMNVGNFTNVTTEQTDGLGNKISTNNGYITGFGNDILDTGFFSTSSAGSLSALYNSLLLASTGTQVIDFQLLDLTPGDQYFDFTQGIDSSLVSIGSSPVVTPIGVTPEPASIALLGSGLLTLLPSLRSRRHRQGA